MSDDSRIVPLDDVLCIMLGEHSYVPHRGMTGVINTIAFMTSSSPHSSNLSELWQRCSQAIKSQHVMMRHIPPPPTGANDRQIDNWLRSVQAWFGTNVSIRRISAS